MAGPTGPFTPWVQHPVHEGRCPSCGLVPTVVAGDGYAYTHGTPVQAYLTMRPTGRTVRCADGQEVV